MRELVTVFLVSLSIDFGRYAVAAVPAFVVIWVLLPERLRARWLRPTPPDARSSRRELLASMRTVVIFALVGTGMFFGKRAGVFRVYDDVSSHGLAWACVTPFVLAFLQDAYFYFTHRLMHHRLLFRAVHLEHHRSRHTSPFTAYAFSPIEALVHAAFVPLVTLVVPTHEVALFVFLGFMIVRNVLGHAGVEIHRAAFPESRVGRELTTPTHHALHHLRPGTNFGLYLTLWDRLLATTDPTYEARFAEVTRPSETSYAAGDGRPIRPHEPT